MFFLQSENIFYFWQDGCSFEAVVKILDLKRTAEISKFENLRFDGTLDRSTETRIFNQKNVGATKNNFGSVSFKSLDGFKLLSLLFKFKYKIWKSNCEHGVLKLEQQWSTCLI